jgi:hypothetical protein
MSLPLSWEKCDLRADLWFIGANPQLNDAAPIERVHDGDVAGVPAAARAFVVGG